MSSVNTTLELYDVLVKCKIPILKINGEAEPLFRIIDRICDEWRRIKSTNWIHSYQRPIEDALRYLYEGTTPDDWSDGSRAAFSIICLLNGWEVPEWNDPEAKSKELDEFLNGFRIVGGDDA